MHHEETRGFTLVEVVVSVVLLALMMIGAYALTRETGQLSKSARDHYAAVAISLARVERGRHLEYATLPLLAEANIIVDASGNATADATAGRFRRTTTVTVDSPRTGLTKVKVVTEVRDSKTRQFTGGSETMECIYTTYFTRQEIAQ